MGRKSIIWNLTQKCLWNCQFCCVDAKKTADFKMFNEDKNSLFAFDGELSFEQKKQIIDNMENDQYRIDFSGGELFIDPMNVELILYASHKMGWENIGVSTSGAFITDMIAKRLRGKVKDVEVTMDFVPFSGYKYRPIGYHEYTEKGVETLIRHGITTGVQTVLTKENSNYQDLKNLYLWVEKIGVEEWSLLRFMPVGRGAGFGELCMDNLEYIKIIDDIKEMTKGTNVKINFQYLLPNHERHTQECRAVKKSIGILPNGNVISCFWALGKNMQVVDDTFLLGSAIKNTITEILHNEKSTYWESANHKCAFCPN